MNVLNILTDKAGKLVFGMAQLGGTVVTAGVLGYTAVAMMGTPQAPTQDAPLRSIRVVTDTNRAVMPSGGSSVSVGGKGQFGAFGEESYGGGYSGGGSYSDTGVAGSASSGGVEAGSEAQEALLNNFSIQARAMGATEGLGLGKNAATEVLPPGGGVSGPSASGRSVAGVDGAMAGGKPGAPVGAGAGGDKGPRLANASIARSSGKTLGSGATYDSRGLAGSTRANRLPSGQDGGEAALSGVMPGGSTGLIASRPVNRSISDFGGSRRGQGNGVGSGSREGNELANIRKRSSDIAKNKGRSANEGADAFLADARNSGGINLENGTTETAAGASSADFDAPHMNRMKSLDTNLEDTAQKEAQRKHHADRLFKTMMALMAATLAAMMGISMLMKSGTLWAKIGAFAIAAAMAVAIAFFVKDAVAYHKAYGNANGMFAGSLAMAGVFALGVGLAFVKPVQNFVNNKVMPWLGKTFGLKAGGVAASQIGTAKTILDQNFDAADDKRREAGEIDPHNDRNMA